ncbi:MAG: prephenate dehydratase domain-containing protein [Minisyncoccia bacterium]
MTIGVSGAKGSFSEEAGLTYARKENIENPSISYLVTVEAVLSALDDNSIDIGIFPIENSNGGIVIEAVYAMAKHLFSVEKMFEIDVHHNLLVFPGTTAEQVTTIASHDQALKQCRMYVKRKWPGVDLLPYADTAKAAQDLASGVLPKNTAVIASKATAPLYGLEILEESIQDLKFNYTSFVVAKKG